MDRVVDAGKDSALAAGLSALLIVVSAVVVFDLYNRGQPLGVDLAPVWAATTIPHDAYDVLTITSVQSHVFGFELVPRPFAYPPTTLLLLLPLGSLSFWYAYAVFVGVCSALFALALRSSSASLWAFAFPPVVILLHVGQVTLMAGSFLLLALASSNWKFRGILFAIAVALKPQLTIFLPLLLILQRDWRSAALAFVLLCVIVAGSIGTFGLAFWEQWGQSLRGLVNVVEANPKLADRQITGSWFLLPFSLIVVWAGRKADAATQLALVVGAALLISPYAMNYELALLVPSVARDGFRHNKVAATVALILATWFILVLLPVLLIVLGFLVWRTRIGYDADDNSDELQSMPGARLRRW